MAGRIPESFIAELVDRVDIVDVISRRVQLKKAGREYKACCPFHDERTPSFYVSPQKQFYHCFGCGAHGTPLGFLMEFEGLEFVDAVEELADSLGLEVPREAGTRRDSPQQQDEKQRLLDLSARVAGVYKRCLKQDERAVAYLRKRGVSGETAREFGLGYAPAQWQTLTDTLKASPMVRRDLAALGLLAERDNGGHYDRFRDRIMFPIHGRRGRVIAFGGRLLEGDGPKYMNSPESSLFHKGYELYNLHRVRRAPGQASERTVLVVEGYMDVIALHESGIDNAVATLGTATTEHHVETLFRTAARVVFCFDGDRAGQQAAWRAAETVLPRMRDGREARFLFLPEGEDPDSLVRTQGREGFQAMLAEATPLSRFVFDQLGHLSDDSPEQRMALLARLRPLIESIPDSGFRDVMVEELAQRSGRDVSAHIAPAGGEAKSRPAASARLTPLRTLVAVALQYPTVGAQLSLPVALQQSQDTGMDLLRSVLDIVAAEPNIKSAGLLERLREHPLADAARKLVAADLQVADDKAARTLAQDSLRRLHEARCSQRLTELSSLATRRALNDGERKELRELEQLRHGEP